MSYASAAKTMLETPHANTKAREAFFRVAAYIATAETRGVWTPDDTAAIALDLDLMTPEELHAVIARIGKAIEDGRITPSGSAKETP